MEVERLEHLLRLRKRCLSGEAADKIFGSIAELAGLSVDSGYEVICRWVDNNHHDVYLRIRDEFTPGGWIGSLEQLDAEW